MSVGLKDPPVRSRTMGRPKGRPKTSERDDVSVKIDRGIVDMARHVATHRGLSLAEVLSESLRAPVTTAFREVLRDLDARMRGGKG